MHSALPWYSSHMTHYVAACAGEKRGDERERGRRRVEWGSTMGTGEGGSSVQLSQTLEHRCSASTEFQEAPVGIQGAVVHTSKVGEGPPHTAGMEALSQPTNNK
uniref:Uncharacterized protein n=1 Tax=Eutreptiella gymnastica TaxID=73025 RepID=A0A7S1N6U8_9EUGL